MEAVVFTPKTKEEVKLLQQLAKQMRIKATAISQEDALLLKAMLQGRTGQQSSREEVFDEEESEIVDRLKTKPSKGAVTATKFVEKWGGFLTNEDTDQSKYDYLVDKHK